MYDPTKYQRMLRNAEVVSRQAQDYLTDEGLGHHSIDEVALLFTDAAELESFVTWASGPGGLELFNNVAQDEMKRRDREGIFDVRFEFLRYSGAQWRIEAMCPLNGDYPLHRKHLNLLGNGCVVHASFKCRDLDWYEDAVYELGEAGLVQLASYQNSYGLFSYWETLETLYYFKPRVNLRDVETQVQPVD